MVAESHTSAGAQGRLSKTAGLGASGIKHLVSGLFCERIGRYIHSIIGNGADMKVVAFNGSARRGGNTAILLGYTLGELEKEGIETELVELSGAEIHGCLACRKCSTKKNRRCSQEKDMGNVCIEKMEAADGILLGSPTYVADVSPEIKALMDRACLVSKANGGMFRHKVGAGVVAVRRAGAMHAFDALNHFFLISEMIVPGSSYWNIGIGREPGDVERDEEGIQTMKVLGQNMAWLLRKIHA